MNSRQIETLTDFNAFKSTTSLEALVFLRCKRQQIFKKGEILIQEGSLKKGVFFVVSGFLQVCKHNEKGQSFILRLVGPGGTFGLSSVLINEPQVFSLITMTDTAIYFVSESELTKLYSVVKEVKLEILRELCKEIADIEQRTFLLINKRIRSQLANLILLLGMETSINLTLRELAGFVGTSASYVSRILSGFVKKKLITMKQGCIEIINSEALIQLAKEARFIKN